MKELKHIEDLRNRYRAAFAEWASEIGDLQTIPETTAQDDCLEGARWRATAAESSYRETRNRLVDEMTVG